MVIKIANSAAIGVIYEEKDFSALNKPAGLLVHRTKIAKEDTVVDWLVQKYPEIKKVGDNPKERPGIVHRLDKDTSGVLLIARNQKFFEYLKNLFQNHQVKKTYIALVHGELKPRKGIIEKPISLKAGTVRRTVHAGKMSKKAVTEYEVIKYFAYNTFQPIGTKVLYFSLVKLIPKTGRTHQLRVHLASIGHPVVGDKLYGKKDNPWGLEQQFLHAESVELNLSDGRRIKLEADLPEKLKIIILKLKSYDPRDRRED